MKKLFLMAAVSLVFNFTIMHAQSCCSNSNCPQKQNCERKYCISEQNCGFDCTQWAKFNSLSTDAQKSLIAQRKKAFIKKHNQMTSDFKANENLTDTEIAFKKEAHKRFKSEFKNIDKKSIAEQKAFFDEMDKFFIENCPYRGRNCYIK